MLIQRQSRAPFITSNSLEVRASIVRKSVPSTAKSAPRSAASFICGGKETQFVTPKHSCGLLDRYALHPYGRDRKGVYLNSENTVERFLDRSQVEQLRVLQNYKYYSAIVRRKYVLKSVKTSYSGCYK